MSLAVNMAKILKHIVEIFVTHILGKFLCFETIILFITSSLITELKARFGPKNKVVFGLQHILPQKLNETEARQFIFNGASHFQKLFNIDGQTFKDELERWIRFWNDIRGEKPANMGELLQWFNSTPAFKTYYPNM